MGELHRDRLEGHAALGSTGEGCAVRTNSIPDDVDEHDDATVLSLMHQVPPVPPVLSLY